MRRSDAGQAIENSTTNGRPDHARIRLDTRRRGGRGRASIDRGRNSGLRSSGARANVSVFCCPSCTVVTCSTSALSGRGCSTPITVLPSANTSRWRGRSIRISPLPTHAMSRWLRATLATKQLRTSPCWPGCPERWCARCYNASGCGRGTRRMSGTEPGNDSPDPTSPLKRQTFSSQTSYHLLLS